MSSEYTPNTLDDPQFIPGENIGTGHGEPVLKPPAPPGENLREFGELIGQTFDSTSEIALWFLIAVIMTVGLVAIVLTAVMSTIRIQKIIGDRGRSDTEMIAAYLARNKAANDDFPAWLENRDHRLSTFGSVSSTLAQ